MRRAVEPQFQGDLLQRPRRPDQQFLRAPQPHLQVVLLWRHPSRRTHALVGLGILTLVASTVVIGYGNYVGSHAGH